MKLKSLLKTVGYDTHLCIVSDNGLMLEDKHEFPKIVNVDESGNGRTVPRSY